MPEFIKHIIVYTIGFYILFVGMGRKTKEKKVIRVPKFISFILFTPLEPGKVTLNVLLDIISVVLGLVAGIVYYYIAEDRISIYGYVIPLMIFLVISMIISDKFKDND